MSRSCGGSHTITSASQRRTGLQYMKHHTQPEVDGTIQVWQIRVYPSFILRWRSSVPHRKNQSDGIYPKMGSKAITIWRSYRVHTHPGKPAFFKLSSPGKVVQKVLENSPSGPEVPAVKSCNYRGVWQFNIWRRDTVYAPYNSNIMLLFKTVERVQ